MKRIIIIPIAAVILFTIFAIKSTENLETSNPQNSSTSETMITTTIPTTTTTKKTFEITTIEPPQTTVIIAKMAETIISPLMTTSPTPPTTTTLPPTTTAPVATATHTNPIPQDAEGVDIYGYARIHTAKVSSKADLCVTLTKIERVGFVDSLCLSS